MYFVLLLEQYAWYTRNTKININNNDKYYILFKYTVLILKKNLFSAKYFPFINLLF